MQLWRALASLTLALSGLVAAVVIATLMVQGLTRHTVAVLPIAVPKQLADKGFVPEVAASRLRDAMNAVAERSQAPKGPEIALRSDVPDIVVPTVGISIDSIVTAIRGFLHSNRRRTISGEFTVADGQLWLRLRLDGGQIYSSLSGGALERPDELLVAAAPHIYHEIDPFVAASYLFAYKDDAAQALMILDTLSENKTTSDRNPADPYVVKAWIYIDRRKYTEAMAMAEQAIRLEPRYAPAHTVRGNVLKAQRRYDEALAEYREALRLDPDSAAQVNTARVLWSQEKYARAAEDYRALIARFPGSPGYHASLAELLRVQHDPRGAAAEFDKAIALYRQNIVRDPDNAVNYADLGRVLRSQGKLEEAADQYRQSI